MSVELATGYVNLVPSAKGFASGIAREIGSPLEAAATEAGSKAGDGFHQSFLGKITSFGQQHAGALIGALGVPLAAGAIVEAGVKIEEALDTIRVKTGKTGAALEGLDNDFRAVAARVPNSFGDVANAVADVARRTGATGPVLEGLSQQLLTVSRVTKTDVGSNVETASHLIENFGIPVDKAGAKLDVLFRASQQSGVGFSDLASQVTSAGPIFRQLGFGLEDSTALIAQLSKQGVDTGPVLMGLKKSLAEMAKAGEDPKVTFNRLITEIRTAKDPIKATQEAMQLFGTRGGAVMAEAIRSGRFQYDEMKKSIVGGSDTIAKAGQDTLHFGEKFKILKNQVLLAVEPLSSKLLDALAALVPYLSPVVAFIGVLAGKLGDVLGPILAEAGEGFAALKAAISGGGVTSNGFIGAMEHIGVAVRAVVTGIHDFVVGFTKGIDDLGSPQSRFAQAGAVVYEWWLKLRPILVAIAGFVHDNVKPVLAGLAVAIGVLVVPALLAWAAAALAAAAAQIAAIAVPLAIAAAIGVLVGALIYAYDHWTGFREVVQAVVHWLTATAWPAIKSFAGFLVTAFEAAARVAQTVWHAIGAAVQWFVDNPIAFVRQQLAVFSAFIHQHWDEISQITHAAWDALSTYFRVWWDVVSGVFNVALAVIKAAWEPLWTGLQAVVHVAFDAVKTTVTVAWDVIVGAFKVARDTIMTIVGAFLDLITGNWGRAWATIRDGIGKIWDDIASTISSAGHHLIDGLGQLLEDFLHWGSQLGQKIVDGIVEAIKGAADQIGKAVSGVLDDIPGGGAVKKVLGHIPGLAGGGVADGWTIVGEQGPELMNVGSPSRVLNNRDTMAVLAPAAAGGAGGFHVEHLEVRPVQMNPTAPEIVDAMDTKLGWKAALAGARG